MNFKTISLIVILFSLFSAGIFFVKSKEKAQIQGVKQESEKESEAPKHPLAIDYMRSETYPGSDVVIEEELYDGVNYKQYIASYKSEGLKIYGLLTVPTADSTSASSGKPASGWPVIIFNHGYIPPDEYRTTERYVAYVDSFARNGYIVFKPDYRGHGSSEGEPVGAYYSPAYTIDVLNAVSAIKRLKIPSIASGQLADPKRIGMWGHSMGGNIALRVLTISKDIRAAVIWGGVVGTYDELMNSWRRSMPWQPSQREQVVKRPSRQKLIDKYSTPQKNPSFWHSIDPRYFLKDISAPIQLDHGLLDESVPWEFSQSLKNSLQKEKKTVEYYTYEGADHNLSSVFDLAMQHSLEFFEKYVKTKP